MESISFMNQTTRELGGTSSTVRTVLLQYMLAKQPVTLPTPARLKTTIRRTVCPNEAEDQDKWIRGDLIKGGQPTRTRPPDLLSAQRSVAKAAASRRLLLGNNRVGTAARNRNQQEMRASGNAPLIFCAYFSATTATAEFRAEWWLIQ